MKKLIFFIIIFLNHQTSFAAKSSLVAMGGENFILAKVNNKAITNSEMLDRYRFVIIASKLNIKEASDKKLLQAQVLDKMIDEELIRQEAAVLKIETNAAEIREALDTLALQQKKNATQLKVFFINNGLSFDNYLKQVESEILWSKIMSEVLRSKVKVTEVEVKEFFEQHKYNTSVNKYLVAEVLISNSGNLSNNAAQLASKLAIELRHGADFKNVVKQFSSGFTSENNGEIGWVSQSDIDPKIFALISKLGKGGYSDPLSLADGYHIFKLLDAKSETKIADQDLTAARNVIFQRKLQTLAKGYLMDIRKKAFVEITFKSE